MQANKIQHACVDLQHVDQQVREDVNEVAYKHFVIKRRKIQLK